MEEFRINNYIVDYETEPYYFKIEEIKRNEQGNLACYYRNGSCWSIAPDRVELTEEILLKCGFESPFCEGYFLKIIDGDFENGTCIFINPNGEGICTSEDDSEKSSFKVEIKYLHQLQNLYFALTNEELTVNL